MVLRRFPVKFSLLASSALLTGLCFAWHNVWFPAFFTLVPALLVMLSESGVTDKKPFRFYGYGYFFGVVFFAAVFQWFRYQYPLEYLGFSKGEAVAYVALSWFGSGFILSLLLSFFFLFTGLFLRSGLAKKHRWLFIPFSSACCSSSVLTSGFIGMFMICSLLMVAPFRCSLGRSLFSCVR